eukprot:c3854_g1_i1.p1 GENE.c3854_g1_i1~~c3854_g1_i1.p1  ORF type:complete len:352 (+),score=99.66 c3854_g1_i1:368-1423(+)
MWTSSDSKWDWYCLHFMQSNQKAIEYLKLIREWMDQHPNEIVVMWFSKHGDECAVGQAQYPDVPQEHKMEFWNQILQVFDGLLFNTTVSQLNQTSIGDLIQRNHRLVLFAADYVEFTSASPLALDSCLIENWHNESITDEQKNFDFQLCTFSNSSIRADAKANSRFFLLSMASSSPSDQLKNAFEIKYLPFDVDSRIAECDGAFNVPNITMWCPPTLMDISLLTNYYAQRTIEFAFENNWTFPNAFYIDAIDVNGTIRTGTDPINPLSATGSNHDITAYAFVDTILAYNVRIGCASLDSRNDDCQKLTDILEQRRAVYPYTQWSDTVCGRNVDWPPFPTNTKMETELKRIV